MELRSRNTGFINIG